MQPFLIKSSTHCRLLQTVHFQLPSTARAQPASGMELAREVPGTPRAHSTTCFGGVGEGKKAPVSSFLSSVLLLTRLSTLDAGPWLNSPTSPALSPLVHPISPLHVPCHMQGAEWLGLTGSIQQAGEHVLGYHGKQPESWLVSPRAVPVYQGPSVPEPGVRMLCEICHQELGQSMSQGDDQGTFQLCCQGTLRLCTDCAPLCLSFSISELGEMFF